MRSSHQPPCLVQHSREGTIMPIDNDALVYSTDHGDLRKRPPFAPPGPPSLLPNKPPSYSVLRKAAAARW